MPGTKFKPVEEQLAYLKKGVAEIVPEPELKAKLEKSFRTGTPLRVYLGVDPTAPDIHLGHTVVLRKLKHFQDLGHTAIFLIGDFSAMIGDPTGRSETRPPLSREEVDANAKTYLEQVFKLLDKEKTEVRYNSEWLDKMSSYEIVRLCGHYRLARMLEREDFRSRLEKNQPISVHELLYPLLTAVDAVQLKSDVELGATEQKFNLLIHRDIQREYGLEGEVAVTMPILVGLDGQRKMSKSLANYVGITEAPSLMFRKIMSISDFLMWSYYDLLTDFSTSKIAEIKQQVEAGTMPAIIAKKALAAEVVSSFYGQETGISEADEWSRVVSQRKLPTKMREVQIKRALDGFFFVYEKKDDIVHSRQLSIASGGKEKWTKILAGLGEIESVAAAERLMKGRGFDVNEETISDPGSRVDLSVPVTYVLKVGNKKPPFVLVIGEAK
ncbi:MAG TPA: tyrosine--tRNA ligase [Candidatus Acidoferrum sp.]|nr:tyrosine--tRNA ligase [Candidatus Acidoferrum sp.]